MDEPAKTFTSLPTLLEQFDQKGYVVLDGVLPPADVTSLNQFLDPHLGEPGLSKRQMRFGQGDFGRQGTGFLSWGRPFAELMHHPRILPLLGGLFPDGFRLEFVYGIQMRKGSEGLPLHGHFEPEREHYYERVDGAVLNGETVVTVNLSAMGPDTGGFMCVPGSHKSTFSVPEEVEQLQAQASCVVVPAVAAGSVLIFNGALVHGTMPWKGLAHRRSLVFKFKPHRPAPFILELLAETGLTLRTDDDEHHDGPALAPIPD